MAGVAAGSIIGCGFDLVPIGLNFEGEFHFFPLHVRGKVLNRVLRHWDDWGH